MFQRAILRMPCQALRHGITTANSGPPDYELALQQHREYADALAACGLDLTILPAAEGFPDSVFVEDAALCTSRCVVITRPGALSRRGEAALIEPVLRDYAPSLERIVQPGTLDAGDVMMVGSHFFIGHSARTNQEGAAQLTEILTRHGMTATILPTGDQLHLKSGMSYLERGNLLVTREFAAWPRFREFNVITVPDAERYAANSIWVNGTVIMPAGYPLTRSRVAGCGYEIIEVDTSEFRKLDGGVSCLSLRLPKPA
jgi:dimethylargininase